MATITHTGRSPTAGRTTFVQLGTALVGSTFLLLGVVGLLPVMTAFRGDLPHGVVHVGFGLAGLACARRSDTATSFLVGGGLVYLVMWLYELLFDIGVGATAGSFVSSDNGLHLGLGVGMILLGVLLPADRHAAVRPQ